MDSPTTDGICELYENDAQKADELVWGRKVDQNTRRGFLKGMGLAAMSSFLGAPIPFADNMPGGLIPAAIAESTDSIAIPGKEGLRVLNDRPINAETPVTLLDDDITPNSLHFVRNNGIVPERANQQDITDWTLTIDGEVEDPIVLRMPELQTNFPIVEAQLVLECGGNGRAGFNPPAKGNQWTLGAVGCARYKGVHLKDVLKKAGLKESAVYIGYYSEDLHLSGDPKKDAISRGVPIEKALDPNTLLVWEMNGVPLPPLHGFPLRLICPGFPASASGKWLKRITVRDQVHDGTKMTGYSYRVPEYPVAPGQQVPEEDMVIIEEMPVKSIITSPGTGLEHPLSEELDLRGHAWCGSGPVREMHVSIDFGVTWQKCRLTRPANPWAWQHWKTSIQFPKAGYYEVWARATDHDKRHQPMVLPGWNPRGYLNNAMQRIAVTVV